MPLNILPKKSWHVGNFKNLARVSRDEAKEEKKAKVISAALAHKNLEHLRQRQGIEEFAAPRKSKDVKDAAKVDLERGGTRLGEGSKELTKLLKSWERPTSEQNSSKSAYDAFQVALLTKDKPRKMAEDPLTYVRKTLGQSAPVDPVKRIRSELEDKAPAVKRIKPTLEELRKERLAREALESEKARKLMLQA